MKIQYKFVTQEIVEVDVSEHLANAIIEFERQEKLLDRRETRRHISLEELKNTNKEPIDKNIDLSLLLEMKENSMILNIALKSLSKDQQILIKKVFFEDCNVTSLAQKYGVSHQAISGRLKRIYAKLKKFFL